MDLSSLEGPPIPDSRFTVRTSVRHYPEIPRIHLDPTPSTSTSRTHCQSSFDDDDYPPRPSSSGSTTLRRYYRNQNAEVYQSRPRSLCDESGAGLLHPSSSSPSNGYRISESDLADVRNRPNQNQLVWCESQKTWVVLGHSAAGNTRPALSQSQSAEAFHTSTSSRGLGQGRDRYMDGDDDLPPPYEDHFYDRILAVQPMSSTHQYLNQNGRVGISRWGAIARRMNRSPGF